VRYGFPLLEQFNKWIALIRESGLILKWVRDASIHIQKVTIVEDEDDQVVKLTLDHIFLALIVLLVGFMIAILTLVAELLT
jgi:hypothetical protein